MREREGKWALYTAAPRFNVHGCFGLLKNYDFATNIPNLTYMTTLRFFDVPDSFLMLF